MKTSYGSTVIQLNFDEFSVKEKLNISYYHPKLTDELRDNTKI